MRSEGMQQPIRVPAHRVQGGRGNQEELAALRCALMRSCNGPSAGYLYRSVTQDSVNRSVVL